MRQGIFFEGVAEPELESALAGAERRHLPKGALVVSEGDYLEEMYVVVAGTADVSLANDNGRSRIVAHIQPGETIGEMSLLTHAPASADVRAHDELDVLVLRGHDLDDVLMRLPQIQRNIISILSERLARTNRLVAAKERRVRNVFVEDTGDPEPRKLGAAGLAASLAWHTQSSTLHLKIAENGAGALAGLQTIGPEAPFRATRGRGADYAVVRPEGAFADGWFGRTLDELSTNFTHVVVEHPRGWLRPAAAELDRSLRLDVLPDLGLDELEGGLLPPSGDAGRRLGKVARETAGLRVGVALGSGSVRGYAHVGALRALERHGVPIDCVAGTSIGAIVGGLYCHYQDPDRVAEFLDELGSRMFRPTLSRKSLLSTRALRRYTAKAVGDRLLEDLEIPLAAVATDVDTHEEVVYRRGSTVTALLASTALPGIFPAVRIGDRTLVDGGIVNPVPTSAAADLGADVIVAVRLVSGGGRADEIVAEGGAGPLPSAIAAILRSVELVQTRITVPNGAGPTIIVTPQFGELAPAKLRHFRDGRRYIALGEEAIEAALPRLQSALPWLRSV